MAVGDIIGEIDSFEFDADNGATPHILNISGTVYAIAYSGTGNDGWLITLTIAADGMIGAIIDSLEWDVSFGFEPFLFAVSGDIYGIAYRGVDNDGWLVTVDIDSVGNIGAAVIDSLENEYVARRLELSDVQKEELAKINKDAQAKRSELFSGMREASDEQRREAIEKFRKLRSETDEQALGLLTAEQKKAFEDMKGEKIDLPSRRERS